MMKGLMDQCASHETVMSHLKKKVEVKEMEQLELTAWNEVQERGSKKRHMLRM